MKMLEKLTKEAHTKGYTDECEKDLYLHDCYIEDNSTEDLSFSEWLDIMSVTEVATQTKTTVLEELKRIDKEIYYQEKPLSTRVSIAYQQGKCLEYTPYTTTSKLIRLYTKQHPFEVLSVEQISEDRIRINAKYKRPSKVKEEK